MKIHQTEVPSFELSSFPWRTKKEVGYSAGPHPYSHGSSKPKAFHRWARSCLWGREHLDHHLVHFSASQKPPKWFLAARTTLPPLLKPCLLHTAPVPPPASRGGTWPPPVPFPEAVLSTSSLFLSLWPVGPGKPSVAPVVWLLPGPGPLLIFFLFQVFPTWQSKEGTCLSLPLPPGDLPPFKTPQATTGLHQAVSLTTGQNTQSPPQQGEQAAPKALSGSLEMPWARTGWFPSV